MKMERKGAVTEVDFEAADIMSVIRDVIEKDEDVSSEEIHKLLKASFKDRAHRKGMVPGYDGEADIDPDLIEPETPPKPTLDDDIAEGMGIIFGGVEEGPLRAELEWLSDDMHNPYDPKIQGRFEYKGARVIQGLDLDEIDHLIFFLDLLDKDTGPWYYYRSADYFNTQCEARLEVLAEEDKAEQEDVALMNEAMAKKRGKLDE